MRPLYNLAAAALDLIAPPTSAPLLLWRAALRLKGRQVERALLLLHEGLERWPDAPRVHALAGRAAFTKGLIEQAKARFAHAAALDPGEPTYAFQHAFMLQQLKAHAEAEEGYLRALAGAPRDGRAWFNLGVLRWSRKAYREAQEALNEAIALRPKDPKIHYALGVCAAARGDLLTASEAFEVVLRLDRRHHQARHQQALLHLRLGDDEAAEAALRRALRDAPGYGPAHLALGRLLRHDPEEARTHLLKAISSDPPQTKAYRDLGRVYERLGRPREARMAYRLYRERHPDRYRTWVESRISQLSDEPQLGAERGLSPPRAGR